MRAMKKALLCLLVLAAVWAPRVQAESGPPARFFPDGKRRALLIGCDHFLSKEDTWPAAEHNLRMMSDALAADDRGYALIRSFCDVISSKEAFEEAVETAFGGAEEKDVSVLYLSTHGVFEQGIKNGEAGLLLCDGETESLLDAAFLQTVLDRIPGTKVVILDACNSGAMIGKGLSGGADRYYLTGSGYKVLCSAGGSEASWYYQHEGETPEAAGASYFATTLCHGLGLHGDYAADRNADGSITLSEAYAFLCDNYAASTPQAYPQDDNDFVLFAYDPRKPARIDQAITDITFEDTLLTAGQSSVTFSFTVQRQTELYYQIVYHQDGMWQFADAQHFLDGEQADGTILPGRKIRTLSLDTTGQDAYGYAMVQLITLEDGAPVVQGARLLCVQPAEGDLNLHVLTAPSFSPVHGQEMAVLIQHDRPCGLTVNILDQNGAVVRRLRYEAPSRPQQLTPSGSVFYWDGWLGSGEMAAPGLYRAQARVRLNGKVFKCESLPFELAAREPGPKEPGPRRPCGSIVLLPQ